MFNSKDYINHLAEELIRNFSFAAIATTPVLKGSAREKEVIKKLEMLLPNSVGVGSGCIIDSYGNCSKQLDIIIYEKEFCPVFSINESIETTYYPCEGVIAVGEIKTNLNSKELNDIFEKCKSVKKLIRYSKEEISQLTKQKYFSYRSYNSKVSFECTTEEGFDQKNKLLDQIFCFALCGNLGIKPATIAKKFHDLITNCILGEEPNLISILNDGQLFYRNKKNNKIVYQISDADSIYYLQNKKDNFEFLLGIIIQIILAGRTVPVDAFNRYLNFKTSVTLVNGIDIDLE